MKKFTITLMTEYLQGIRCRKRCGRFNKCWEVFACFVAFNHGWDSAELLDAVNTDSFISGFEDLRHVGHPSLAKLTDSTIEEVDEDSDYFLRRFGSGN